MDSVVFPDVRLREMRTGIGFIVSPSDRLRLAAIISAPSSPQKHVWRARIVLLSADGTGTSAIMSATGKPATCVWRWQERFMVAGVVGLLHEKTRPPGIRKTAADKTAEVIRLGHAPPPPDAAHWTLRTGRCGRWQKRWGLRPRQCRVSGRHMALPRIAGGSSSCRTTRPLPKSCTM